ncbi:MAG: amidohydrolase family protein, partial [Candidatus Magasanikbacteria bacterium]
FKIINMSKLQLVLLVENINEKAFQKSLKSKFSLLSTQGIHLESEESNKLLKLLKKAEDRKIKLSKEEIIQKITRKPAKKYRLEKRGQIKKGYYADINIIKNNTIQENIVNGEIKKGNGKILK